MKIIPELYPWTRKNWLNYGSHPPLEPDLGILQDCKIRHFSTFAFMSAKTDRMFVEIVPQMYSWTRNSPSNFGSHPDRTYRISGDPDRISLGSGLRFLVSINFATDFIHVLSIYSLYHYQMWRCRVSIVVPKLKSCTGPKTSAKKTKNSWIRTH